MAWCLLSETGLADVLSFPDKTEGLDGDEMDEVLPRGGRRSGWRPGRFFSTVVAPGCVPGGAEVELSG